MKKSGLKQKQQVVKRSPKHASIFHSFDSSDSATISKIERDLDLEEVSISNYSLSCKIDPLYEFELYSVHLGKILGYISDRQLKSSLNRGFGGLSKAFNRLLNSKPWANFQPKSPKPLLSDSFVQTDEIIQDIDTSLEHFKEVQSSIQTIQYDKIVGQLKNLFSSLQVTKFQLPSAMGNIQINVQQIVQELYCPVETSNISYQDQETQIDCKDNTLDLYKVINEQESLINDLNERLFLKQPEQKVPDKYTQTLEDKCVRFEKETFELKKQIRQMKKTAEQFQNNIKHVKDKLEAKEIQAENWKKVMNKLSKKNSEKIKLIQEAEDRIYDLQVELKVAEEKENQIQEAWKKDRGFDFIFNDIDIKSVIKKNKIVKKDVVEEFKQERTGSFIQSIITSIRKNQESSSEEEIFEENLLDPVSHKRHRSELIPQNTEETSHSIQKTENIETDQGVPSIYVKTEVPRPSKPKSKITMNMRRPSNLTENFADDNSRKTKKPEEKFPHIRNSLVEITSNTKRKRRNSSDSHGVPNNEESFSEIVFPNGKNLLYYMRNDIPGLKKYIASLVSSHKPNTRRLYSNDIVNSTASGNVEHTIKRKEDQQDLLYKSSNFFGLIPDFEYLPPRVRLAIAKVMEGHTHNCEENCIHLTQVAEVKQKHFGLALPLKKAVVDTNF